jgi:hypothetical protein
MKVLLPALVQYRVNRGSKDPWESGIEAFITVTDKLERLGVINEKLETDESQEEPERIPEQRQ